MKWLEERKEELGQSDLTLSAIQTRKERREGDRGKATMGQVRAFVMTQTLTRQ